MVKLKETLESLDLVVIAAEYGHGRKAPGSPRTSSPRATRTTSDGRRQGALRAVPPMNSSASFARLYVMQSLIRKPTVQCEGLNVDHGLLRLYAHSPADRRVAVMDLNDAENS